MNLLTYSDIKQESEAKDVINGYIVNVMAVFGLKQNYFEEVYPMMKEMELTIGKKPKLTILN